MNDDKINQEYLKKIKLFQYLEDQVRRIKEDCVLKVGMVLIIFQVLKD